MIRCLVIDDEPYSVELMEDYVRKTPFLHLEFSTTNPLEAIDFLRQNKVDIIFLDVQMPELTGIDFMNSMPGHARVVLCTSSSEYALEGYEHNIVDYLLKPINYSRFLKAANKVADSIKTQQTEKVAESSGNEFLFIKSEVKGKLVRIDYADIDYIESIRNYVAFYKGKEKKIALLNMKDLEAQLPVSRFLRVHKSYIVAIEKIKMIEGNFLRLKESTAEVPIGGTYKETLLRALNISG